MNIIDPDTTYCGTLPQHDQLSICHVDHNWISGKWKGHEFQAKVFSKPSTFGINEGRVSKLSVYSADNCIFNYDRGPDIDHPIGHEIANLFDVLSLPDEEDPIHPGPEMWWWLSFCDTRKAAGEQFLGACIVQAPTFRLAVSFAGLTGCNPGGEVQGVPTNLIPGDEWSNRLLNRDDCNAFDIAHSCPDLNVN